MLHRPVETSGLIRPYPTCDAEGQSEVGFEWATTHRAVANVLSPGNPASSMSVQAPRSFQLSLFDNCEDTPF